MEIKEGMYVRFSNGIIAKCIKVKDSVYIFDEELDVYGTTAIETDNINDDYFFKYFKASFNIIDLIKVGDYVNGKPVAEIDEDFKEIFLDDNDKGWRTIINERNIKSIVTKEQFESMSYKVGE